MIEFMIAMRRIQDFVCLDEINPSVVSKLDREECASSFEIWKGNFHWGAKIEESEVASAETGEVEEHDAPVKDYMALKNIDLQVK